MKAIDFEKYLIQANYSEQTIASCLYYYSVFRQDNPSPDNYGFRDVVNYLNEKTSKDKSSRKLHLLNAIKRYFNYLVDIGKREDHPCKTFYIRCQKKKGVIHQDLFSTSELEQLMEREERYVDLKLRNQVIISLLIYQGLTSSEISRLNVKHVDLDKGTVFIKGSRKISQRHLEIDRKQFLLFDRYINDSRKKFLKEDTEVFIPNKMGNRITVDDIKRMLRSLKGLFPDRNVNSETIRQSVISNWLNERKIPLEQAQLMSGQKWISTTEKYRQTNGDEQRELMNKWFPI